jgi:hypothetical protein
MTNTFEPAIVDRIDRTDETLELRQKYTGTLKTPQEYNAAFANVLRAMADKIDTVKDAFVDPEVTVWMHKKGIIAAEVTLSPE